MNNEELLNNVRKAYETRKKEINKDLHDYNYWELYMKYELCEWLMVLVEDYAEDNREFIEYLKTKSNPLEWMYEIMLNREDKLWENISYEMGYQMRQEKEHNR